VVVQPRDLLMRPACTFVSCLLAACAGAPKEEADAGVPVLDCDDADGDGYGVGADCPNGEDCNDDNRDVPRISPCDDGGCDEGVHDFGCACDPAEFPDPEPCYTGPADTEGVGECAAGARTCAAATSSWSSCADQVTPQTEVCNYVDDDCDDETDEFVKGACGCGIAVGPDCTDPFAPTPETATGVVEDADGSLVLVFPETSGTYTHHFSEPCTGKANSPAWTTLSWSAEIPDGASLTFAARTEWCEGDPGGADWTDVAVDPSDTPPADVRAAFAAAGEAMPVDCLGVRVTFTAGAGGGPRLRILSANLTCR
jgi:hypothetical protein